MRYSRVKLFDHGDRVAFVILFINVMMLERRVSKELKDLGFDCYYCQGLGWSFRYPFV